MEKKISTIQVCIVAALFFGISLLVWLKPDGDFSQTERRKLKQFPKLDMQEVWSGRFMENFEGYATDQFPFRDGFRSVKAVSQLYIYGQSDNNGVYVKDGHIAKIDYPLYEKALQSAVRKYDSIYRKYIEGTNASVYHSVIPDKSFFLSQANGYPSYDYNEMTVFLQDNLKQMEYIDITDLLSAEDFYYTDTHWRQECIKDVAGRLGEKMGVLLTDDYVQVESKESFYGVYYGQLGLPMEADRIIYLEHEDFAECTIINHETGKEIPMYDLAKAKGRDAYEMFLSGSLSVITIENPNASTEKELVMFRDSFGSSLAPLFVEAYAKITIIDARYINEAMIGNFVTFDEQDVLFIHSTGVINNMTAF